MCTGVEGACPEAAGWGGEKERDRAEMPGGDEELELGGEFTYVQELPRLEELLRTVSSGASGFMRQDMHGAARVCLLYTSPSPRD